MQKILRYIGKIAQVLITVLLALLLACNLYLIIMDRVMGAEHPTILGYSTAVVVSGSMEPALSVDDFILNHIQASYEQGDIITFQSGDSLTTHRIIAVTDEGYMTQGDANNAADQDVVLPEKVIGRVVMVIPYIGNILAFFRTPLGMMLLVFIGFLLIELPFFFRKRKEQPDGEEV